jgi:hypothetical protein
LLRNVGFDVGEKDGLVDGEVDDDGLALDEGTLERLGKNEWVGLIDCDGVKLGVIEGELEVVGLVDGKALGSIDSLGANEGRRDGVEVGGRGTTNDTPRGRMVTDPSPVLVEAALSRDVSWSVIELGWVSTPASTDNETVATKATRRLPPITPRVCRRGLLSSPMVRASRSIGVFVVRSAMTN